MAADNLTVLAGTIYRIQSPGNEPAVLNYDTVLVEQGASIVFECKCSFNCQQFTQAAGTSTVPTLNFAGAPWSTPALAAAPGADGAPGQPGQTPSTPSQAAKGQPGPSATLNLGTCSGPITISYGGGDGQQGAAGGNGGNAGPPATTGGQRAQGGDGGTGGAGGDGGDTGQITITYTSSGQETFTTTQVGCAGGAGGAAGQPGQGQPNGSPGQPGPAGTASVPPQIQFIKAG